VANKAVRITVAAGCLAVSSVLWAQEGVDKVMNSVRASAGESGGLSIVRESALRETATTLGARQGLRDKSCAIRAEIDSQRVALDKRFRFSDLMMGRGVLPPVISEARDSVALDATVMRVASRVYHLDEGARVIDLPPTWRDWLLVGLSPDSCTAAPAAVSDQLKPKSSAEEAFFREVVARSYEAGQAQAKAVLEDNLARLERSYAGMRRYYDLYQRGMVSAPVIMTSTDVVKRDDPNTLIVGNTVIRITVPVDFVEKVDNWKPLAQ
jgi:hypothetical protein